MTTTLKNGDPKIAIVTGGAGFIGSHMVDLLIEQGYRVRALDNLSSGLAKNLLQHQDNPMFDFLPKDLQTLSLDDPSFDSVDYVFHFAGMGDLVPSIERPVDYLSVNTMGTIQVLEASRRAKVKKFVYAASSSCYGLCDELPTTEQASIDPQYPYALSKYLGEQAAFHWNKVYNLPVISIRIFNAYGPRARTTGAYGAVFGVFLAQVLAGMPLTVVGDGTQSRDFVYATDVARAFLLAAESERAGEFYNLGSSNPQSINHLVELLGNKAVYLPKRPGEPQCTWANTSKIREHLDWEPQVTFEQGVENMLRKIEDWSGAPVWDVDSINSATTEWFKALSTDVGFGGGK